MKKVSTTLTDSATPQAEMLGILAQTMGNGLYGLRQNLERILLRQDIKIYYL
jgi:hypothetical protein